MSEKLCTTSANRMSSMGDSLLLVHVFYEVDRRHASGLYARAGVHVPASGLSSSSSYSSKSGAADFPARP